MSKEEDQEDDTKLYQCVRKYEKIVKQFDELINIINARTTKPPKRRRVASGPGGSSSATAPAPARASSSQPDNNEVLVQTISKFLHELRVDSKTGPDGSTSTRGQE